MKAGHLWLASVLVLGVALLALAWRGWRHSGLALLQLGLGSC